MASISEIGHSINVDNFNKYITNVESFGAKYTPTNPNLSLANLKSVYTASSDAQKNVILTRQGIIGPINRRKELFDPLPKLVTRITSFASSLQLSPSEEEQVVNLGKKFKGIRIGKITLDKDGKPENSISVSHQSYVMKQETFFTLVEFLKTLPKYAPKEAELSTATLSTTSDSLKKVNDDIYKLIKPYSDALDLRDKVMYDPMTGLVNISKLVKKYVVAAFGNNSKELKSFSGLSIRYIKR